MNTSKYNCYYVRLLINVPQLNGKIKHRELILKLQFLLAAVIRTIRVAVMCIQKCWSFLFLSTAAICNRPTSVTLGYSWHRVQPR